MELKEGQILNFVYGQNLWGKLIQWRNQLYNKSPYTHTAIITKLNRDGTIEIAQAISKGFELTICGEGWTNEQIKLNNIEVGETKAKIHNVREFAKKYEGTGYGFMGIFYIILSFLGNKSIKWSDGAKSMICSEAIARVLYDASDKKINFEEEFGKDYDLITPDDLSVSKQIRWL